MICPFCDYRPSRPDTKGLARHVLAKHRASQVGEHVLLVEGDLGGKYWDDAEGGPRDTWVRCWCGEYLSLAVVRDRHGQVTDWELHLDNEGGMEAHVLQVLLEGQTGGLPWGL